MKIVKSTSIPTSISEVGMYLVHIEDEHIANGIYIVSEFVTGTRTVIKISKDNDKYSKSEVYTKIEVDAEFILIDDDIASINEHLVSIDSGLLTLVTTLSAKASISSLNKEISDRLKDISALKDQLDSDKKYLQSQINTLSKTTDLDSQYIYDINGELVLGYDGSKLTIGKYITYDEEDYVRDINNEILLDKNNNKITFNK